MPELRMYANSISYRIPLEPDDARVLFDAEGYGRDREIIPYEERLHYRLENNMVGIEGCDYTPGHATIFVTIQAGSDSPELHQRIINLIGEHLIRCRQPAPALARRSRQLARAIADPTPQARPRPHGWRDDL